MYKQRNPNYLPEKCPPAKAKCGLCSVGKCRAGNSIGHQGTANIKSVLFCFVLFMALGHEVIFFFKHFEKLGFTIEIPRAENAFNPFILPAHNIILKPSKYFINHNI